MKIPTLYTIADADLLKARGMELRVFAAELRRAGVSLVQYRDKTGRPQQALENAAVIADLFEGVERTLIMNDRADLAVLAGFDGVHVGQQDLSPDDAKAVMRRTMHHREERDTLRCGIVGISTHTPAQVIAAEASVADYVAVGPVFATGTKLDAPAVVGLEGVRRARALTTKPLVAIGGITLENARSVIDAGANTVAVISGLFVKGETLESVAREFLERLA